MSASNNNLSLVVNQQDSSGVNIINRSVGAIAFAGVAGEFEKRTLAADTSIHTFDIPVAIVLNIYFKNTHATALILLTGTVQGGSTQTIARLPPGGVFVYWAPVTGATVGYTELRYTSDTASATCEYFFGG
jgi:hypothetical protein